MSTGGITTADQLKALERRGRCAVEVRTPRFEITQRQPTAPRLTLEIPPPANGCTYTAAEAAKICGVGRKTLRNWISVGRRAGGATVYLDTLAVPAGEIAPEALCRFLSRVNLCDVVVKPHGASPGTPLLATPSPGPPRNSFNSGSPQRQGGTEG